MIAVLINTADVRLGEVRVSSGCLLIKFGGAHFVKTDETAVLSSASGETGSVFVATEVHVYDKLDVLNPTSNFSKRPEAKR